MGKQLSRSKREEIGRRVLEMRSTGNGWKKICAELHISNATARRYVLMVPLGNIPPPLHDEGLSDGDRDIVTCIAHAVRGERIPRELHAVWRQPFNEIAVVLREHMRRDGMILALHADQYVTAWVTEQRSG